MPHEKCDRVKWQKLFIQVCLHFLLAEDCFPGFAIILTASHHHQNIQTTAWPRQGQYVWSKTLLSAFECVIMTDWLTDESNEKQNFVCEKPKMTISSPKFNDKRAIIKELLCWILKTKNENNGGERQNDDKKQLTKLRCCLYHFAMMTGSY